jgi:hypothetical protein
MRLFLKGALVGGLAAALVLVATSAIAGTGIGGVFNLGKTNRVNKASLLVGKSGTRMLQVTNRSTGDEAKAIQAKGNSSEAGAIRANNPNGPAAEFFSSVTKPPFTVSSNVEVANLRAANATNAIEAAHAANADQATNASQAANANTLDGLDSSQLLRSATVWKFMDTIGEKLPVEIGHPACTGDQACTATLRCDPGDVLLSGGYDSIDIGTRLSAAFPFNANGNDQAFVLHWENNSTVDTVRLMVLCANQ